MIEWKAWMQINYLEVGLHPLVIVPRLRLHLSEPFHNFSLEFIATVLKYNADTLSMISDVKCFIAITITIK